MEPVAVRRFVDDLEPAFHAGDEAAAVKSTEAANVAVVRGLYEALARGDEEAFVGALADDMDMETVGPADVPVVGRWRGRDAVLEGVRRNFAGVEDQRPEVLTVVAQGDTVVVYARERGRVRATGRAYDINWVHIHTLAGGKIARFRQVFASVPPE